MTFATSVGNIDIQVGDMVGVSNGLIPVQPVLPRAAQVVAISGGNTTQVMIGYYNELGNPTSNWIDAIWIFANYRPILPS